MCVRVYIHTHKKLVFPCAFHWNWHQLYVVFTTRDNMGSKVCTPMFKRTLVQNTVEQLDSCLPSLRCAAFVVRTVWRQIKNGEWQIVLGQLSTHVLYLISSSGTNTTFTVAGSCKVKDQQIPNKNVETVSTEQVGVVTQQQGVYMIVYKQNNVGLEVQIINAAVY